MAKITDKADLRVGTELTVNEPARTYTLNATGNLVAKDGVSWQAFYSKMVDLWATSTYQDSPFPMNALDALSGQYLVGVDAGGNYNGWGPANDATRQMLRDGGCEEYNSSGGLLRVYAGIGGLGGVSAGAQLYYQRDSADAPTNFTFEDQVNEMIQVYGDASNGNFDKRTYFKGFVREYAQKYKDSILADTGKTETGAFIVNLLLSNETDLNIIAADGGMSALPYSGIDITYGATTRTVAGVSRNFNVIIDGNGATLQQIYTKVQYLLRQNSDIDSGAGSVNGKTAADLLYFVGSDLNCTQGVYIDNVPATYSNNVVFRDTSNTERVNPYQAAGVINFNPILVGAGSSYRLMFTTGPGSSDDYGEAGALTVEDADGNPITGVISGGTISFSFDYDGDTIGGTAGTDKAVTLVGVRPGYSKYASTATGILTRSKVIGISLVAETDRAYV